MRKHVGAGFDLMRNDVVIRDFDGDLAGEVFVEAGKVSS